VAQGPPAPLSVWRDSRPNRGPEIRSFYFSFQALKPFFELITLGSPVIVMSFTLDPARKPSLTTVGRIARQAPL
jgi:hypothetical protein